MADADSEKGLADSDSPACFILWAAWDHYGTKDDISTPECAAMLSYVDASVEAYHVFVKKQQLKTLRCFFKVLVKHSDISRAFEVLGF